MGLAPLVAAAQLVHRRLAEALALARHHHGEARAEVLLLEPAAMHAQQVRLHLHRRGSHGDDAAAQAQVVPRRERRAVALGEDREAVVRGGDLVRVRVRARARARARVLGLGLGSCAAVTTVSGRCGLKPSA